MKQSPLFSLNWNDAIKGLIMAVGTPALFIIQQAIANGQFVFNWKQIGMAALAGGVAYLVKNFFTPADPTKEVTKTDDGTVTKTVVNTDTVKVEVPNKN
jgi:hypothetical protein